MITRFWLPFMAPCLGTIERIVRQNNHTRIVSLVDNIIPHEKRIGDKLFAKYFVKSTQGFVAMSKSVLDDLTSFDNKKPRIYSPHPLYDHYGERISKQQACSVLKLDPSYRYVLFFGFIRGYKGLDLLLEAFADKRLKDLGVKLIVAGEFYGNEEAYMKQIKDLRIDDRIELHTYFIPDEKVNNYFCAADRVAQPYKTATQSGVTQIAFHFEKSMLVTNVGGLPEIVPHGKIGYVVEPNAGDIANALVDFYENERMAVYETNVKEEKQKYAWSNMIKAFNDLAETIS